VFKQPLFNVYWMHFPRRYNGISMKLTSCFLLGLRLRMVYVVSPLPIHLHGPHMACLFFFLFFFSSSSSSSSSLGPVSINAPVCTAAVDLLCNGLPPFHKIKCEIESYELEWRRWVIYESLKVQFSKTLEAFGVKERKIPRIFFGLPCNRVEVSRLI
jgi:hypothetical protein